MPQPPWDYYVTYFDPNQDPETDGVILRHRPGTPRSDGQAFGRAGEWIPSTTLLDIAYGHNDKEALEITQDKARQLLTRWVAVGRLPKMPDDLEPLAASD